MAREEKFEVPEEERDYALQSGHMELSWQWLEVVMEKERGEREVAYAMQYAYVMSGYV